MSPQPVKVLAVCQGIRPNFNVYRPEAAQLAGIHANGEAEVTVITNDDSVCVPYFREHGMRVLFDPLDKKLSRSTIGCIRRELQAGDYDILHLINNTAISNGSFAALGLPVKVIAYRGQTGNTSRWSPTSYLSVLHPRIDMVICVAKAVEIYVRSQQWGHDKATTIYKGHSLDWYTAPPTDLEFLHLPDDVITLSLVADIRPRKGLHVLMAATHDFTVPNIHILLVGGEPDNPAVREHKDSAAQPEQVHALGYRTDAPEISAASDMVVLPTTKREGLSRAILEAMAYGRPAVVSDTGGNAELVADGESGFVVPPSDPQALAAAISRLAGDPELRDRMGAAARQRITELFSVEQGVAATLRVYRMLAEQKVN
jgi:glycosyltransferase involved in cell wall biosynthesis